MRIKFGKLDLVVEPTEGEVLNLPSLRKALATAHGLREDTIRFILAGKVLPDTQLLSDIPDKPILMFGTSLSTMLEDDTPFHLRTRVVDDLTKSPKRGGHGKKKLTMVDSWFGSIQTLPGLPMEEKAKQILTQLATDRGIVAIMAKYNWKVPVLAELYPEGEVGISDVCILGLNENKGQRILLRIRTDDLEGFRRIDNIRNVLIHELTHNVHGDHDSKFYKLMRVLQKEATALDWERSSKGRRIDGTTGKIERYEGGDSSGDEDNSDIAPRVLDPENAAGAGSIFKLLPASVMAGTAAVLRLSAEEQEVQDGCGGCGAQHGEPSQVQVPMHCLPCDETSSVPKSSEEAPSGQQQTDGMDVVEVEDKEEKDGGGKVDIAAAAVAVVSTVDGARIRQDVISMFDEAIALSQQFSESSYTYEKLQTLCSLVLNLMLVGDGMNGGGYDGGQEDACVFRRAEQYVSTLLKILAGARDPSKRSLNKASKVIRNLQSLADHSLSSAGGGLELLLCLGFTEAEAEGRLVMRLYDESFAYLASDLLGRVVSTCQEALKEEKK